MKLTKIDKLFSDEEKQLSQRIKELVTKSLADDLTVEESWELVDIDHKLADLISARNAEIEKAKGLRKRERRKVNKRWKASEDWVNKAFGLKREGHMKRGLSVPDGVNEVFSIDITSTKKQLAFIERELLDAEAHATQSRTPVVIILPEHLPRKRGYWIQRVETAIDLHGNNHPLSPREDKGIG